ncbi:MAG TPA: chemotaxis protein CheX [Candidatus Acidoferrales bacterium]|nr:chemotaxis protein CheX [Candidatus Acidoferrales bacterium]
MNTSNSILSTAAGRERWLPTLQLAMQEVFELMLGCALTLPSEPPPEDDLEITSMVGLAGQLCGILTVRCSVRSAARMASRMLGVDAEKAGQEMWDAVGEICNMVAGNFKNKISGMGDGCMLSVPTVITGGDYSVHSMVNENLRTVFLFEGEPVILTLEVHS